jgi:FAD synthetase
MSLERLVTKYISSAEQVLHEIKITEAPVALDAETVMKITNHAGAYLDDAKYYRQKRRLDVSLTSVAYCEGLLDALRLLQLVKFEWPEKARKRRLKLAGVKGNEKPEKFNQGVNG